MKKTTTTKTTTSIKDRYYEELKRKHAETNWNDRDSIRAYNEYARLLRSLMEYED